MNLDETVKFLSAYSSSIQIDSDDLCKNLQASLVQVLLEQPSFFPSSASFSDSLSTGTPNPKSCNNCVTFFCVSFPICSRGRPETWKPKNVFISWFTLTSVTICSLIFSISFWLSLSLFRLYPVWTLCKQVLSFISLFCGSLLLNEGM